MRRECLPIRVGILLAVAMGLMASSAYALVQHPNTEAYPNSEEQKQPLQLIPDRPDNSVVGWWSYNASAVAIGSNYILTTCHQGGGVGNTVHFGSDDYRVAEVFQQSKADLRIARIVNPTTGADANLANYVGYYKNTDEKTQTAVIGGFGFGRGAAYPNYYTWNATDNKTERWGQNYIEGTGSINDPSSFSTQLLGALFDNYGTGNWRPYEACVAWYDSGGGWFLRQNGTGPWQVAGLSRGATAHDAPYGQTSWFNPADTMDCVRVSMYAGWLDAALGRSAWNSSSGGPWSDGMKWSNGVPGLPDAFAVFSDKVSAGRTVTLTANAQVGTFRFDCPGDLAIDAGGSGRLEFAVTNTTTDSGLLEASNVNGSGALSIAAPVKMTSPLTVRQNSGTPITISGMISDPSSPSRMLTKTGTGMLVLTGANTYKGGTSIYQGTLRVTNAGGLGSTISGSAYVTIVAGATLDLQNDSAMTLPNKVKVILNSSKPALTTATLNADRATPGTPRTMTFSGSLTTDGAVTLSTTSATGCSAVFSGPASITNLGASGVATINTASADLALTGGLSLTSGTLTKAGPKMLTLSGTQTYGSGTTLKVTDGTLALNDDAGSSSAYNLGVVTSNAATVTFGSVQHLASLSIGGTSNASVAAGGTKTLLVKSLDIAGGASPTARLDMADNNLVVDYSDTGVSPLAQVQNWVKHGANFDPSTGNLQWNGTGITSSAIVPLDPYLYAVGVREAVDAGSYVMLDITDLEGVTLGSKAVVVKYTWMGDVNLDGVVDQNDYDVMDYYQVMGTPPETDPFGSGWWTGDLNGDGVVDQNDYDLADYGQVSQGAPLGTAGPGLAGLSVLPQDTGLGAVDGGAGVVPEPGTLLVLFAGAAGLLSRRRRAL